MAVSCKSPEPDNTASLTVKPTSLSFAATGNSSRSVVVEAVNTEWEHEVSGAAKDWISVSADSDGKTLRVSVTDNTTSESRSGMVSVKAIGHVEIKPIGVTVTQEAGEAGPEGGSITVSPESLTFAGEGAEPQEVAVTVSDEELTWTAAPEEAAEEWITVTANGGKFTVKVADNPETESRSANIIITPGREDVKPKAVRVTQEGKILPPSLEVDQKELSFDFRGGTEIILSVTAVNCEWACKVEYAEGETEEWVKTTTIETHAAIAVSTVANTALEPRTASIIVYALGDVDLPEQVVAVTQEAGKEFLSDLTGPVVIDDMAPAGGFFYSIFPSQLWDIDDPGTHWDIELWGGGVTRSTSNFGKLVYGGDGSRIRLTLYSPRIPYNDDQEFTLPAGTYEVKRYESVVVQEDIVPYTIVAGRDAVELLYTDGWYVRVENGRFAEAGPLVEGSMTVDVTADGVYTFVFDFKDDKGNPITGTFNGEVTEAKCNFFEEPEPTPDPDPDPDPEDPDPGFGQ